MKVRRPFPTVLDGSRPTIPTIRKFSPTEIEERRKQGLCFHCNDKYGPRHLCKKLFILEACYPDDMVEDYGETIEFDEESAMENIDEAPAISLHAISGTHTPQTMKVRGTLGKYRVIVLLDSGSTHNFLKEDVASKLGLLPDKNGQLDVKVASGGSSIKATPFEVVYGRSPPSLLSYVPSSIKVDAVDQALQDRDAFLKVVRQRLLQAQERMKRVYDQKHREVELEVDDWVTSSFKPTNSSVFSFQALPIEVDDKVHPQAILDRKQSKGQWKILVHWQGYSPADATWEDMQDFTFRYPQFALGDKDVVGGEEMLHA
ncbi:hypothetical protein F0562_031978 [Nyssa sinensis]|uniref:Chromo domain-containing protein n=1 Tax=Nyssa sinensis TaxID=561372 RepID=A0A5J5AZP8_9ASTE|nr:hypothetical protein F0562_031978 [Nyssa sinensis]